MGFDKFLTKLFGSSNQRFLKSILPLVEKINSLEPSVKALSDDDLRARTARFKEQVQRAVGDPAGGFRSRQGGQRSFDRNAALRRAADRRHRSPSRQDRRDAHG